MRRVLVTGASGFLGRQTLEPLKLAGFDVVAVSRHRPPWAECRWVAADLLAPKVPAAIIDAERPSHLLHCAWNAVPGEFWTAPDNDSWRRASVDLLTAFCDCRGRRALMLGSCAEYDWTRVDARPIVETFPLGPTTVYGSNKVRCFSAATELCQSRGVALAWARLFFLFGPGEDRRRFVAQMISRLLRGEVAECNAPGLVRDFLDTRDAGTALAMLLDAAGPAADGAFNVASGSPVSLGHIAHRLAELSGRPDLLRLGGQTPSGQPPILVADVSRLRAATGFQRRYPLEVGLADAVEAMRVVPPRTALETP
jgi:nucleoside-diphosphate-sugar epimerase